MNLASVAAVLFPTFQPRPVPALALTECIYRRCGHGAALAYPGSSTCPVCRSSAWVVRSQRPHRPDLI